MQPLLINQLIIYFKQDSTMSRMEALVFGMLTCLAVFGFIIMHHPYGYKFSRYGMQMRVAVCGLIYRKVTSPQTHSIQSGQKIKSPLAHEIECKREQF
jgi:hypothetical protein